MNLNPLFIIIFSILIYLIYKDLTFKNIQTIEGFDINGAGLILESDRISMTKILSIDNNNILLGDPTLINTTVPSLKKNNQTANGYRLFFDNSYNGKKGSGIPANKIVLHNNNFTAGFGIEEDTVTYHSGKNHSFYTGSNNENVYGIERFCILTNGNIGIGTNNPTNMLTIQNNLNSPAIQLNSTSSGWGSGIVFNNTTPNTGKTYGIYSGSDSALHFSANWINKDYLKIKDNGYIGISSDNPIASLHIGDANSGLFIGRDAALWDHIHMRCLGEASYFDIGGAENGAIFRVGAGGTLADPKYQEVMRLLPEGIMLLNHRNGGAVIYGHDAHHSIWLRKGFDMAHDVFDIREFGTIRFFTDGNIENQKERMRISKNGFVGIGTDDPKAPLHVNLANGITSGEYAMMWHHENHTSGGNDHWRSHVETRPQPQFNTLNNISIIANQTFVAGRIVSSFVYQSSDKRIKSNIIDLDQSSSLEKLRLLTPKQYNNIDIINNGNLLTYGFIAQEVHNIVPHVVKKKIEYIPNIYKLISYNIISEKNIIIYLESNDILVNDKLKFIQYNNTEIFGTVIKLENNNLTILLDDPLLDSNNFKIFLYGKQVDDFHVIDKDQLLTINFSATKELDKKVQALELENKQLKHEVSEIKLLLQQVLAKLN
jgi:hypothetical protein